MLHDFYVGVADGRAPGGHPVAARAEDGTTGSLASAPLPEAILELGTTNGSRKELGVGHTVCKAQP